MSKNSNKIVEGCSTRRKVIIGFKGSPIMKILLTKEAETLGQTLSTHLLKIVESRMEQKELLAKKEREVMELSEKLAEYENHRKIQLLYEKHKGQSIEMPNEKGVFRKINSHNDVLIFIINSFKSE